MLDKAINGDNRGDTVSSLPVSQQPSVASRYQPPGQDDVMTAEQCASWLQIDLSILMDEAKSGGIPAIHLGDQLRFHARSVVEAFKPHPKNDSLEQPLIRPAFSNNGPMIPNPSTLDRIHVHVWLSVKEAAHKLGVSTDTIERRAIPWQPQAQAHKVRFKMLVLDKSATSVRRYYEPDLEAWV